MPEAVCAVDLRCLIHPVTGLSAATISVAETGNKQRSEGWETFLHDASGQRVAAVWEEEDGRIFRLSPTRGEAVELGRIALVILSGFADRNYDIGWLNERSKHCPLGNSSGGERFAVVVTSRSI